MMDAFRRISSLVRKEYNQLIRDRSSLVIGIVIPIMLILLIGYGMSLDVKNVPVAVVMEDASPTVQDMLSFMDGSDYFDPRYTTSMKEGTEMMNRREVDAIIRVPPNFTENLFRGGSHVQIILWGVDAASARTAGSYLEAGLASWQAANASKYMTVSNGIGFVSVTPRQWFNDANTSTWFFIPGLVVLIMTLVGVFLTTMVMAREWERGTLEALFITPVRPIEILLIENDSLLRCCHDWFLAMHGGGALPIRRACARVILNDPSGIGYLPHRDAGHGTYDFVGNQKPVLCVPGVYAGEYASYGHAVRIYFRFAKRACRGLCRGTYPSCYILYGTFEIALPCGK